MVFLLSLDNFFDDFVALDVTTTAAAAALSRGLAEDVTKEDDRSDTYDEEDGPRLPIGIHDVKGLKAGRCYWKPSSLPP